MDKKRFFELERIFKGAGNHRRIEIMYMLEKKPELSLSEIAENLSIDFRTVGEHVRKLAIAGLIMKRHDGNAVRHALTTRGNSILKFCRTLE
ncbi:MAG: winged helix-turn-helix domain-containing protein [Candidatus Paceibacterota bacterium]